MIPISTLKDAQFACYGICCQRHGDCQRYLDVESASTVHVIASCDDGEGNLPAFKAAEQRTEAEAA